MDFAPMSRPLWCIHLLIFCLTLLWLQYIILASTFQNESDYLTLLKFQKSISSDPNQMLNSWNTSNHFCSWYGITCSHKHQRVRELKLEGYGLRGTISPHVGNLSFLRNLSLNSNYLHGEIPAELGRLFRLKNLNLSDNAFTGKIPINLTRCTELRNLVLSSNRLTGNIPLEIGSLRKLERLSIYTNNLNGQIPSSVWNLTSLHILTLAFNNLEGSIPDEIGHLKNLRFFAIGMNKFSGTLPSSLYNMSSLTVIATAFNQLNAIQLPDNMFSTLPNLQTLNMAENQISGSIPTSITNASSLQYFDVKTNYLVGKVPNLRNLRDFVWLNLAENNLGSGSDKDLEFITSLENCSKFEILSLTNNKFGGVLPNSIANLSTQLKSLYLGFNQVYGTIPSTIGKYTNLIALGLENNRLTGTIPASFGKLHELQLLGLGSNQLYGEIPTSLSNLSQLVELTLLANKLEGTIPPIFGNWKFLTTLDLSKNNLSGVIPLQIFSLSSLSKFLNLSHNSLKGSLPTEVGTLKSLGTLDISENDLSGEIPRTIGECTSMEYLYLQGNLFSGTMPSSLASLKGLIHLDLSQNNLSGSIPTGLQNSSVLEYLNVSFNMLDGEVPTEGVFRNASAISMVGNNKLCGGISELHLSPCPIKVNKQSEHHHSKFIIIIICVAVCVCLLLSSIFSIFWRRKRNKTSSSTALIIDQLSTVSYRDLHFATEGFSTVNLIGSGSSGSVYKGRLESENKFVAVKVLNLQKKGAHKSFISECNALKNVRHRNLVKILTCCSSIDYKGQEFKALVFEYMSNGSLENWLHPESVDQPRTLDLDRRLNILCNFASALRYLHHECEQPIIHCDLKPSNILLDDDMIVRVSDFGLARMISVLNGFSKKQTSTTGIKGTIGYAPPEYGIGFEISTMGDVYSFGILVLEMLTGRRPTEEMFKDGLNLHSYVKVAYPNNLWEIADSILLQIQVPEKATSSMEEISMEEPTLKYPNEEKAIVSLFEIGLACSVESPKERLNMMDVTRELNRVRNAYNSCKIKEYCY